MIVIAMTFRKETYVLVSIWCAALVVGRVDIVADTFFSLHNKDNYKKNNNNNSTNWRQPFIMSTKIDNSNDIYRAEH